MVEHSTCSCLARERIDSNPEGAMISVVRVPVDEEEIGKMDSLREFVGGVKPVCDAVARVGMSFIMLLVVSGSGKLSALRSVPDTEMDISAT